MHKRLAVSLLALTLTSCGVEGKPAAVNDSADAHVVSAPSERNWADYSKSLAAHIGVSIGLDRDSAEAEIRSYFGTSASSGAIPIFNSKTLADGRFEILATRNGLRDDSVKSEQLLAHFAKNVLIDYGMRVKCYRNDAPDEWTKEPCP